MKNTVYFDNNATTAVAEEVFAQMEPYFCQFYGNPSSMHTFGGQVGQKLRQARAQVADLLGCQAEEIVFTGSGTESDNTAIKGAVAAQPGKRKIITSRVEHPAVLQVCRDLEAEGYTLIEIGVDDQGRLDMEQLERQLDENTAIVTIMHANNETGVVFPIEQIARMVTGKGIVFHTDAVQTAGKIPLNMKDSPIDLLSISAHKLHGPKGVGALYVRKGTRIKPFIVGGHQEANRRAGTENVPGIIGLGHAALMARENIEDENSRVKALRDKLETQVTAACPNSWINGKDADRLPNTTNISFEYIEGEAILLMLDQLGICASSGSACTSGSLEPSHVLRAMGIPFTAAHGSIRFSLSRYNTDQQVDYLVEHIPAVINRLRELSPFISK